MRKYFLILVLLFIIGATKAQYNYFLDLNKVYNDQVLIELVPPKIDVDEIRFKFPAIVPGTYTVYDFGRFVSNVRAEDSQGNSMEVDKENVNTWKIPDFKNVSKITYRISDSWDWTKKGKEVFEPAGTNIEDSIHFMINHQGFFGYFEGYQNEEFVLNIRKPKNFYGSTSLVSEPQGDSLDVFRTKSYSLLVDAPIMYCRPDTTVLNIGGAEILVSVFSPDGEITSQYLAEEVGDLLVATQNYLGGTLPIKKYAFLIYLFDGWSNFGAYGALEHNTSSVYFLPQILKEMVAETVLDIASHEFFHIRTPLGIHSKEIHDFDFDEPKMSQHLWLYEGVTEYSSIHMQVRHGLMSTDDFLDEIKDKIVQSRAFKDNLPFTALSRNCLDEHEDQYMNVYQKGALIGMCLDILLLEESDGKYGVNKLLHELSDKFGPDRPFNDDELFTVIEEMTYPSVGQFFKDYVDGTLPIPYSEFLAKAGVDYQRRLISKSFTLGGADVTTTDDDQILIYSTRDIDDFGEKIGYREGDIIDQIDGKKLTGANGKTVVSSYFQNAKEGDPFVMVVLRKKGKKGKRVSVRLKTKLEKSTSVRHNVIQLMKDRSEVQDQILRYWLGDFRRN